MAYVLASTTRLIEDSAGRVRIRTGVWNFEEAVIDVSAEPPAVGRSVKAALIALGRGPMRLSDHLDPGLLPIERANIERLFADIAGAGMITDTDTGAHQDAITAALLGRLVTPYPTGGQAPTGEVLFLTDSDAAKPHAQLLAEGMRLKLTVVEDQLDQDLTSRVDGLATEAAIAALRPRFTQAAAIVTCFQRPWLPMLRNLNRLVEGQDTPWVSAFIDGPFVSVVGIKSPHTGCFECFEQRALARLEDHVSYHDFARSPLGRLPDRPTDAPMLAMLTAIAVTEGYLHAATGTSRFSGRALSIHLPTWEIQTQDLLRMPNCPACGKVSRQRLREINFNSRAAVDRVVAEVLR